MIVPCNSCGRALSLPEGGHRPEAVKCPECGASVRVSQGPASWEDAEPEAPSDPDWFILVQAKQVGPLDARALVERVRSGEVHGRTFVWRDGFDGWRRALEVPELLPVLEQAGAPATPPHGPLTPAEGLSPPGGRTPPTRRTPPGGGTPPRSSTPAASSAGPRRKGPAPVAAEEELELELSRVRPRGRTPAPPSDFVPSRLHRRSPWKLAVALSAALVLPVGGLGLLVSLRRPPAVVEAHSEASPDSAPAPVAPVPVRRVQQLRELLLGKPAEPAPAAPAKHAAPAPEAKVAPKPAPDGPKTAELRALYGDARKPDVGPRVRRSESAAAARGGGPSNEEVARVVGQTQSAFQSCIEQQLRKSPGFHGGKVSLLATVGSSGTVKQVQLDRRDLEGTDLGDCLKARARRMVFTAFSGPDVDVEIPLVLTTSL
ncbi:MAG: AgmX/PglI C-terminal domain-containing protein [Myxococcaceae bacterium]